MNNREYKFDNLRFLLIFLVVMGHLLEIFQCSAGIQLYRTIYSFHVPFLIFISGYFAKFELAKIATNWFYPYLVFQTIAIFLSRVVMNDPNIPLQFFTPYWLLWYLMVISFYYILVPIFTMIPGCMRPVVVIGMFLIGLLSGYHDSIGYFLSLGRFFGLLPFFVLGLYCRESMVTSHLGKLSAFKRNSLKIGSVIIIGATTLFLINTPAITPEILYHSSGYHAIDSNIILNICAYLIALIWIVTLILTIPEKRLRLISQSGRYTLSTYLLHGFLIPVIVGLHRLFPSYNSLLISFSLSLAIVLLFSNPYIGSITNKLVTGTWIVYLIKHRSPIIKRFTQPQYSRNKNR